MVRFGRRNRDYGKGQEARYLSSRMILGRRRTLVLATVSQWKETEEKGRGGIYIRKEGCRNRGNGYKNAISVVWSIAITSVPSFRRSVTRSLGNRNPKTLLRPGRWLSGEGGSRGREGRGRKLNGYISISFVHPQKLPSAPLRCSRGSFSGLYHFEKETALCRTRTFAK